MKNLTVGLAVSLVVGVHLARACDCCPVYCPAGGRCGERGFYVGATEQFTHFGMLQLDGRQVANESGQWLNSSIAHALVGYNFNEWAGVQLNVPFIHREFRRPEGFEIDRGHVAGLGDVALTGQFQLFARATEEWLFRWTAQAGVKFPTGSSARLAEEAAEVEVQGAPESGIHGHDLALGSGSVDGLIGSGMTLRWRRALLTANLQYNLRSEGAHDYRYADDLTWAVAPGVYLLRAERQTLALQFVVSGEVKGKDTFQGAPAEDTAMTSVYVGPQVTWTWTEKLSVQVGADLPVLLDNSALQAVPDFRVRAAATWRF